MGGGDLNMKKSWHPLLLKNQERVWLEEKKALEEKKKLDQLRKEKEEERQLQELQRLQEEQTGKKRTEKLEWMYTTPATGSSQNPNDLEDYLLGKKRVDKILTADENAKLGASHKNFIAVQNANTVRDIASKIREDPLLLMKQQEQAAYQVLMSNPLRLRELQERNGIKPKKAKEKKEKRHNKEREGKERMDDTESAARRRRRSRSASPLNSPRRQRSRSYERHERDYTRRPPNYHARPRSPVHSYRHRNEYGSRKSRSRSPDTYRGPRDDRIQRWSHSDESDNNRRRAEKDEDYGRRRVYDSRKHQRSLSPRNDGAKRHRTSPSLKSPRLSDSTSNPSNQIQDRAARLAAMQADATNVEVDRQKRLLELLAKEKAELETENEARLKSRGIGNFLSHEQKKVFGGEGGLEDRIRRGRGGLVADTD